MKRQRPPKPEKSEKKQKKENAERKGPLFGTGDWMSGMKKFKRKAEAAKHAREKGLYIVGYDISDKFHKAFITCTGEELFYMVAHQQTQYTHLAGLPGGWRNIYEGLLWERPCAVFFDLDAEVCHNPGILKRIDEITQVFIEFVTAFLKGLFPSNLAVQGIVCPDDWIVLDSSNRKKASRHLLLRKKGVEFRTMEDHSKFFERLEAAMRHEAYDKKTKLGRMFYVRKQDKDSPVEICLIADRSVYSIFQLMRMFLCSKKGQKRPLLVASAFDQHPSVRECFAKNGGPYSDPPTRRLFTDCLISHVCPTVSQRERLSFASFPDFKAPNATATTTTTTKTMTATTTTTTTFTVTSSSATTATSADSFFQFPTSSTDVTTDKPLAATDWRVPTLIAILKNEPYLRGWMVSDKSVPADFKICPTRNKGGEITYIVTPLHTQYCPIRNLEHDKVGKVWVTVPPRGRMKLKCMVNLCKIKCNNRAKAVFLRSLDRSHVRMLWPNKT